MSSLTENDARSYEEGSLAHWIHMPTNRDHTPFVYCYDLTRTELALSINAIHERDRHLANGVTQRTCPHHHLHLKDIAPRHGECDNLRQDPFAVQPGPVDQSAVCVIERSALTGSYLLDLLTPGFEHRRRQKVGTAVDELALEVPAVYSRLVVRRASGGVGVDRYACRSQCRDCTASWSLYGVLEHSLESGWGDTHFMN